MSTKRMTLALSFLMTLTFSASALAAPGDGANANQLELKGAIASLGLDVANEQVVFSNRGRRDLVVTSADRRLSVVKRLKRAYRSESALANGYKVVGYAHIVADDSYTFTFEKRSGSRFVAQVKRAGAGSKIKLWGSRYAKNPRRMPVNQIPRRHMRNPAHVVR